MHPYTCRLFSTAKPNYRFPWRQLGPGAPVSRALHPWHPTGQAARFVLVACTQQQSALLSDATYHTPCNTARTRDIKTQQTHTPRVQQQHERAQQPTASTFTPAYTNHSPDDAHSSNYSLEHEERPGRRSANRTVLKHASHAAAFPHPPHDTTHKPGHRQVQGQE